jgi:Asp-tRNA(Asn)/Glu-tRNA(Gln) amidotransferase A subunit family amidase
VLHTFWGNPAFADYGAESDVTVVARVKDAGAIVLGKTNVHAMLADLGQTTNELYGRRVHKLRRTLESTDLQFDRVCAPTRLHPGPFAR